MTSLPNRSGVLFGAAYYAEYQPHGVLERDLDLMVDAGFNVIRVGESVWSTWEPREGVFELEWLAPVLDAAHSRGIAAILGTPTYAVPPWLQRMHPEIAVEASTGRRNSWGARQEMDQSHPTYRFFAERVARKVVERYAAHPAVIGFQVDNEPGLHLAHNHHTFQRFIEWLKDEYVTVERLNEAWGLVYWSHRLSDWADLWRPDGNMMPQYQLAWRRFQTTLATELIRWQADLVREYAREDQFVTTCISYARPQIADDELVRSLDVVAGNPYYHMQDGLEWGVEIEREEPWWHTGVWALFQWADRAWSSAQSSFLVTETNAQTLGGSWQNFPPYPGQLRQAAFAILARGGQMIEYWQWQTLHFGGEAYWGGVLPHSLEPGRIYREIAALGADLKTLGGSLDSYVPDGDALLLYSGDTKWAFQFEPPLARPDGGPNDNAYLEIFDSFYRGLFEAGAQVRVQHVSQFLEEDPTELAARFPVLVAPALYVVNDEVLDRLRLYAEAGGHLILGIRTGYGDEIGRVRRAVAPDRLVTATGIRYDEFSNLKSPLAVESASSALHLEQRAQATEWVDILQVDDAEPLVTYASNGIGAGAAVTSRKTGTGRVTYVGTVPNPELSRSLARWAVPVRAAHSWGAPESVTVSTGTTDAGAVAFISNWSGQTARVVAPVAGHDLVTGDAFAAGDPIHLAPRAALVVKVHGRPIG